jgi:hypothetical protein
LVGIPAPPLRAAAKFVISWLKGAGDVADVVPGSVWPESTASAIRWLLEVTGAGAGVDWEVDGAEASVTGAAVPASADAASDTGADAAVKRASRRRTAGATELSWPAWINAER